MVHVALLARLEAKPGKAADVAALLKSALPLAIAEPATTVWFALQLGPTTFVIFDAFPDEDGRKAHLAGQIAPITFAPALKILRNDQHVFLFSSLKNFHRAFLRCSEFGLSEFSTDPEGQRISGCVYNFSTHKD